MQVGTIINKVEGLSGMRVRALVRTAQAYYVVFLQKDHVVVPAVVSTQAGLSIVYDRLGLTTSRRAVLDSVVREVITKGVLKKTKNVWIGELFGTRT